MGQEQRRFDRTPQPFQVRCRRINEPLHAWDLALTHDLSAAGMRIQSSEPFDIGTILDVQIELPNLPGSAHLQGRVVWGRTSAVREYGIEFVEITPDQQALIDELVQFLKKRP